MRLEKRERKKIKYNYLYPACVLELYYVLTNLFKYRWFSCLLCDFC